MKAIRLFIGMAVTVALLASCGSKKPAVAQTTSPFGPTSHQPCLLKDTKEKFVGSGIARGSSMQKGEVQLASLRNAKAKIHEKVAHVYKGLISDYSSNYGNNRGNDIVTKLEKAGEQFIDVSLNDAYEVCTEFSNVFEDGTVECYIGLEIEKAQAAETIAKQIADFLTPEEKTLIDFKEAEFIKRYKNKN